VNEPNTLWPALCHLDLHSGNVLMSKFKETEEKKIEAIIDWEFAGVADPRIDVAHMILRETWTGDIICKRRRNNTDRADKIWSTWAKAVGVDNPGNWKVWVAFFCLMEIVQMTSILAMIRAKGFEACFPRCDLMERVEDLHSFLWILRDLGYTVEILVDPDGSWGSDSDSSSESGDDRAPVGRPPIQPPMIQPF
jgi:hypothetical protein